MKAIDIIKGSRKIHIGWVDYYRANPGAELLKENQNVGDIKWHKRCIKGYDEAIADIMELQAKYKRLKKLYKRTRERIRELKEKLKEKDSILPGFSELKSFKDIRKKLKRPCRSKKD